jgi:hypothetical protein
VVFTLIEFISSALIEGEPPARWVITDRAWLIFLVVTVVCGFVLQMMKKWHWLDAVGR